MTNYELLVPVAYQEDESKCNVCLAIKALDEAHRVELLCLSELESIVLATKGTAPATLEETFSLLRDLRDNFHVAQTEYAVAFAVSLTLYHTVEKPELHGDAKEALMAYQEYRSRASDANSVADKAFARVFALFQKEGWSEAVGSRVSTLHLAHQGSLIKRLAFWQLTDKWTDERHDKAFDFLSDLIS